MTPFETSYAFPTIHSSANVPDPKESRDEYVRIRFQFFPEQILLLLLSSTAGNRPNFQLSRI